MGEDGAAHSQRFSAFRSSCLQLWLPAWATACLMEIVTPTSGLKSSFQRSSWQRQSDSAFAGQ